ncbi:putative metal-binding motif-containing protein, partial [Enterobacter hormaechei]|uniref:putative metal-binding motif-containing protein n=1 Tax=Enterobacter hormaechei TaxID=158836 RepID=UPI0029DD6160
FYTGERDLQADDVAGAQSLYGAACDDDDGDGVGTCHGDCDDANALVLPGATETCNDADDDCDGVVDATSTTTLAFGS